MLFAYSEVPESTTGFSPFELLYGREVRGPSDMLREKWRASQNARGKELQIGEKVLVVLPTTSNKLLACGPYSVLHRINKMNYEVHM